MNLSEFIGVIRGWIKYQDPDVISNALITSWVRMAEERVNNQLRVKEQLQIDTANIVNARVVVPNDWQENDFVRLVDGKPLRFLARDEFYSRRDTAGHYTTSGRFIIFGGAPNVTEGRDVELHYFADIPPLDDSNWVVEKYPSLMIAATLAPAFMYLENPSKAATWDASVDGNISSLNDKYRASIGSGSKIKTPRPKGFG